mmetsp:Transcript_6779/g.9871  ORF Transcript_6779/g.9871 Transcript_6779/m.9871 type:complete len:575 (-) Transcript_6779:360-2084(-)
MEEEIAEQIVNLSSQLLEKTKVKLLNHYQVYMTDEENDLYNGEVDTFTKTHTKKIYEPQYYEKEKGGVNNTIIHKSIVKDKKGYKTNKRKTIRFKDAEGKILTADNNGIDENKLINHIASELETVHRYWIQEIVFRLRQNRMLNEEELLAFMPKPSQELHSELMSAKNEIAEKNAEIVRWKQKAKRATLMTERREQKIEELRKEYMIENINLKNALERLQHVEDRIYTEYKETLSRQSETMKKALSEFTCFFKKHHKQISRNKYRDSILREIENEKKEELIERFKKTRHDFEITLAKKEDMAKKNLEKDIEMYTNKLEEANEQIAGLEKGMHILRMQNEDLRMRLIQTKPHLQPNPSNNIKKDSVMVDQIEAIENETVQHIPIMGEEKSKPKLSISNMMNHFEKHKSAYPKLIKSKKMPQPVGRLHVKKSKTPTNHVSKRKHMIRSKTPSHHVRSRRFVERSRKHQSKNTKDLLSKLIDISNEVDASMSGREEKKFMKSFKGNLANYRDQIEQDIVTMENEYIALHEDFETVKHQIEEHDKRFGQPTSSLRVALPQQIQNELNPIQVKKNVESR